MNLVKAREHSRQSLADYLFDDRNFWNLPIIIIFASMLVPILILPDRINQDTALYVQYGKMLLQGQVLYLDLYDMNLPLISYLNVLPAFVARLTSVPVIVVFNLFILFLLAWSVFMIRRIILRGWNRFVPADLGLLLLCFALASFCYFIKIHMVKESISLPYCASHSFSIAGRGGRTPECT